MRRVGQISARVLRSRHVPGLMIGLALLVLGATILGTLASLRHKIHLEIVNHDGELLHAVSLMQQFDNDSAASLANPADQLDLLINISRLKGVLGIRLFAPDGRFVNAFPAYIEESALPAADLPALQALRPVSHFDPAARLSQVDLLADEATAPAPLLFVCVPLHEQNQDKLLGIAQFVLDGGSIAREMARLDRNLAVQSAVVFCTGGGLLTLALVLAFRRLQRANRLLADRTASLLRANRELALAAKTSALGAVTSHLIHGLKNPLSGLQSFVNTHHDNGDTANDTDWREAAATTKRMQTLIGEVVRILQDEQAGADYEVTLPELVEMLSVRIHSAALARDVRWVTQRHVEAMFSNREANLILLVLENLVQNAIQATPSGKAVQLDMSEADGRVVFEVSDEGTGLPPSMAEHLFTPCRSTKDGGSGIGLAISKQLAAHLGGALELKRSSALGCAFLLAVPRPMAPAPVCETALDSALPQPQPCA